MKSVAVMAALFVMRKEKGETMKFLHTGDLHIGKTLHEISLLEDQKYILKQIADVAKEEKVDALIVAGDVYDRSIPAVEAVSLLDDFLTEVSEAGIKILLISGNHDSGERLMFMEQILEKQNIFLAGDATEPLRCVTFEESDCKVTFVLLPFIKPALVGAKSSDEAVRRILERENFGGENNEENHKYVLVTHFFVTDCGREPELSDSETQVHVGGIDNVEASAFSFFDYVALGHIHKPQTIREQNIVYSGTPLKYSFSEVQQKKSVVIVEVDKSGVAVTRRPLFPMRDMRTIKGTLTELMKEEVATLADREDYIQAILTDKEELIDPIGTLRSVYPNIMHIILEKNEKDAAKKEQLSLEYTKKKSTEQLFEEFYTFLRGEEMDEARRCEVRRAMDNR